MPWVDTLLTSPEGRSFSPKKKRSDLAEIRLEKKENKGVRGPRKGAAQAESGPKKGDRFIEENLLTKKKKSRWRPL